MTVRVDLHRTLSSTNSLATYLLASKNYKDVPHSSLSVVGSRQPDPRNFITLIPIYHDTSLVNVVHYSHTKAQARGKATGKLITCHFDDPYLIGFSYLIYGYLAITKPSLTYPHLITYSK